MQSVSVCVQATEEHLYTVSVPLHCVCTGAPLSVTDARSERLNLPPTSLLRRAGKPTPRVNDGRCDRRSDKSM